MKYIYLLILVSCAYLHASELAQGTVHINWKNMLTTYERIKKKRKRVGYVAQTGLANEKYPSTIYVCTCPKWEWGSSLPSDLPHYAETIIYIPSDLLKNKPVGEKIEATLYPLEYIGYDSNLYLELARAHPKEDLERAIKAEKSKKSDSDKKISAELTIGLIQTTYYSKDYNKYQYEVDDENKYDTKFLKGKADEWDVLKKIDKFIQTDKRKKLDTFLSLLNGRTTFTLERNSKSGHYKMLEKMVPDCADKINKKKFFQKRNTACLQSLMKELQITLPEHKTR